MREEAQLHRQDPRRSERRRGDSDLEWGDTDDDDVQQVDEVEEGVQEFLGWSDKGKGRETAGQDTGEGEAKDKEDVDDAHGMEVDALDLAAMRNFVGGLLGAEAGKHVTMDDVYLDGGHVDDDSDEDRADFLQRNMTWAEEDEDFIQEIQDMLDENEDVLTGRDGKQRNALFRSIRNGTFEDLEGFSPAKPDFALDCRYNYSSGRRGYYRQHIYYNLDYPSFYPRLYTFVDREVLNPERRSRFFRLTELFLSSTFVSALGLHKLQLVPPTEGVPIGLFLSKPFRRTFWSSSAHGHAADDESLNDERSLIGGASSSSHANAVAAATAGSDADDDDNMDDIYADSAVVLASHQNRNPAHPITSLTPALPYPEWRIELGPDFVEMETASRKRRRKEEASRRRVRTSLFGGSTLDESVSLSMGKSRWVGDDAQQSTEGSGEAERDEIAAKDRGRERNWDGLESTKRMSQVSHVSTITATVMTSECRWSNA
ncbi:hypothetical protein BDZ97DRAFT_2074997 [Flammula alnicola]|nr:hypothetical protein BDZ97DRAFT_2074997 [Flammula alnicola]